MKAGRILCWVAVVVLALFAIVAIWRQDWLGADDRVLIDAIGGAMSAILAVPLVMIVVSRLCPAKQDAQESSRDAINCKADYEAIEDPYPEGYKPASITRFHYDSRLRLMRLKKRLKGIGPEQQYIVAEDYTVSYWMNRADKKLVTVPAGTVTDLASVPRCFRWYVGRVGPHLEASIIHDYLYIAWQLKKGDSGIPKRTSEMRRFADDLMLAAMKEAGMGCKALVVYRATRCFGKGIFFNSNPEPLILDLEKLFKECGREKTDSLREEPTNST